MRLKLKLISIFFILSISHAHGAEAPAPPLRSEEEVAIPGHKEMGCMACHKTEPKSLDPKDRTDLLSDDINTVCRRCHDVVSTIREGHQTEPTPYTDQELTSELGKINLPLTKGNITCATCHHPHAAPPENFFLRPPYLEFLEQSKSINPHWQENRCAACHKTVPIDAKNLYLKYDEDFIKMCNICHESVSAQSLVHSVGMVPSPDIMAKIPKTFSLSRNSEVVCITCHELKYQCLKEEFKRKGLNPLFFRGGPYAKRTDLCYKCHDQSEYKRLNPHDQINDEGELIKDRCLYCHAEVPNPKTGDISKVSFQLESDLKALCQRCHRDRAHPGGQIARPNFAHLVKPPRNINEWRAKSEQKKNVILPLEPGSGKVFCCTCHNPHERGIQRRQAADKGSDGPQRLRLAEGYTLCESCHGFNK